MKALFKNRPFPALPADKIVIGAGMLLMAVDPVLWLINTWLDPSYDSKGLWVFLACGGILSWSLSSPVAAKDQTAGRKACILLALTALVRAFGQVFAVNVIGALALVIDVYAIGLLLQVAGRKNTLSAGWLAVLFAFALPLERILQRTVGYALQNISAKGACSTLQSIFDDVHCEGVRILIGGQDVLVDLPCSGARMLILLCILYAVTMTVTRASLGRAVTAGMITLAGAFTGNVFRICALAALTAYPVGGINVMAQPWHDIAGLLALMISALPLMMFAKNSPAPIVTQERIRHGKPSAFKTPAAFAFLAMAVVIVLLPRKAIDIAPRAKTELSLPSYIHGKFGEAVELTRQEKAYFTAFGGSAVKNDFGDRSLMLIRTSSPLRHLHAPDECLRGMGFDVEYKGISYDTLPTAIYTATRDDGSQWRIAVTFYSDAGHMTTNVSEAVWIWTQNPATTWHALQRITPLHLPETEARKWDQSVFTALDLTPPTPKEIAYADIR